MRGVPRNTDVAPPRLRVRGAGVHVLIRTRRRVWQLTPRGWAWVRAKYPADRYPIREDVPLTFADYRELRRLGPTYVGEGSPGPARAKACGPTQPPARQSCGRCEGRAPVSWKPRLQGWHAFLMTQLVVVAINGLFLFHQWSYSAATKPGNQAAPQSTEQAGAPARTYDVFDSLASGAPPAETPKQPDPPQRYVAQQYPPQQVYPSNTTNYRNSAVAENGSYYGQISTRTGRPRTVLVHGYYRKDGTYVRGHYRSKRQ